MKKVQINIDWPVVFWVSIIILFLWLLAKAFGLINTPWIVEAIPYTVGLIAIFAIVKEAGKFINKLEMVILDIKDIKADIRGMRNDIHSIDKRVTIVESRI